MIGKISISRMESQKFLSKGGGKAIVLERKNERIGCLFRARRQHSIILAH